MNAREMTGSPAVQSPSRSHRVAPLQRVGSRSIIESASGTAVAEFRLETYDRKLRVATYTLSVYNATTSEIACACFVIAGDGAAALLYPRPIVIRPNSNEHTSVLVRTDEFENFERAFVELRGQDVHFSVEAAAPQANVRRTRPVALAIGAAALAGAALFGAYSATPRVAAFSLAPRALTGTTVEAQYKASGIGSASYEVRAGDGRRVAGGPLPQRSGTFDIKLPQGDPGAYAVTMTMAGPVTRDSEMRMLTAVPPPPPKIVSAANISAISVSPVVAMPGQVVRVNYAAGADSGYVRLLDDYGTIWAQVAFSRTGTSYIRAPLFVKPQQMRIMLHVQRGKSAAQSSAGLIVMPPKAYLPPTSLAAGARNGVFQVVNPSVPGGGVVYVHILSPRDGMRIALTDTQGHSVADTTIGSRRGTVRLNAPRVSVATRYVVVASFTDGYGQESIVQSVMIVP